MFDVRKWHRWAFGIGVLILAVVLIWLMGNEQRLCMGVRLLTEKEAAAYARYRYEDISEQLLFNGEKVAVDAKNHTIYLSQKISDGTKPWQLEGKLSVDSEDHQLFFLKDEFGDMSAAVQRGENFSLLVTDGSDCFMRYRVVFTALPVVCLEGEYAYTNEDDREVLEGRLCVWDPEDPAVGRYSVKTTDVQWHLRGGSTAMYDKKSWKLSAKTPNGENRNVSLLGLGADDDWILNAMSMDDTKVKEKVLMQLWNALASEAEHNYPMSMGEYVEVVINGEYYGVYLLQRRVDKKYLQLEEDDILLKGKPVWEAPAVEDAYEIISSPLTQKQTYQLMYGVWSKTDMMSVVPENFVDVSLLIQLGLLTDNNGYKNMFYVLQKQENGYAMYMVPWDTDLAFGTTWLNGFVCDKDLNMHTSLNRIEYDGMKKLYPQLDEVMAQRWQNLRTGVFGEENIYDQIQLAQTELTRTGALLRDEERWGQRYAGADTVEEMYLCIQERLAWLDSLYGQAA